MTENQLLPIPILPEAKPLIGHLQTFRRNPLGFLSKHAKNYSGLFAFKLFSKKYIVLNHPQAIQHVLTNNVKNYTRKKSYSFLQELLGMGLLTNEGEEWRSRRRLAQPNFGREKLAVLISQMDMAIVKYSEANFKLDTSFSLDEELNHLTLAILTQSILYSDNNIHFEAVRNDLKDALEYLTAKRFNVFNFLSKLPSSRKRKGHAAITRLKALVMEIITERRNSTTNYNDLLEMLMSAKDEESNQMLDDSALADEIMTMFVAGHETTASALLWTIYLLETNTAVRDKMLSELDTNYSNEEIVSEHLLKLPYLRMVIMESMRLYPPVWSFGRRAIADDKIMGHAITAGASVNIPVYCIHRHPDFWEKPEEFYPEHFLPEAVKARDKFAYLPFSQGMHRCIGEHFAIMEMQMILMRLYKKYKIVLEDPTQPELQALVTLRSEKPIYIKLQAR